MDEALLVGGFQSFRDLARHAQGVVHRHRTLQGFRGTHSSTSQERNALGLLEALLLGC